MTIDKDILMMLGRMDAKLDGISARQNQQDNHIKALGEKIDGGLQRVDNKIEARHQEQLEKIGELDERLRDVEKKSAIVGAVGGSAAGIGVALIVEAAKAFISGNGPNIP
jgi:hypothetical protein